MSREAIGREPKSCELCREYGIGSLSLSRLAVSGRERFAANGAASETVPVLRNQVRFCGDAVYNSLHRFSILFSFAYIFMVRRKEQVVGTPLAPYIPPAMRSELYLVIGELHHPKRPQPAATPQWLIVPERGLFTGIAIFGAVGSDKTRLD